MNSKIKMINSILTVSFMKASICCKTGGRGFLVVVVFVVVIVDEVEVVVVVNVPVDVVDPYNVTVGQLALRH